MKNLPIEIRTERLILSPVHLNHLDPFYEAFSETFEELTEY